MRSPALIATCYLALGSQNTLGRENPLTVVQFLRDQGYLVRHLDSENTWVLFEAPPAKIITRPKGTLMRQKRRCPNCGSENVRHSRRRGLLERLVLRAVRLRPYRCEDCDERFLREDDQWRQRNPLAPKGGSKQSKTEQPLPRATNEGIHPADNR